jgi:hypothetical protein
VKQKTLLLWSVSVAIAIAVTVSALGAHELSQSGFYRQMPGIFIGLLVGFALDNQAVVIVLTIATNAYVYHLVLRFFIWTRRRFLSNRT